MIIETEFLLRLIAAAIAGGLVGLERKIADKPAGIRTLMLVSMGRSFICINNNKYHS